MNKELQELEAQIEAILFTTAMIRPRCAGVWAGRPSSAGRGSYFEDSRGARDRGCLQLGQY